MSRKSKEDSHSAPEAGQGITPTPTPSYLTSSSLGDPAPADTDNTPLAAALDRIATLERVAEIKAGLALALLEVPPEVSSQPPAAKFTIDLTVAAAKKEEKADKKADKNNDKKPIDLTVEPKNKAPARPLWSLTNDSVLGLPPARTYPGLQGRPPLKFDREVDDHEGQDILLWCQDISNGRPCQHRIKHFRVGAHLRNHPKKGRSLICFVPPSLFSSPQAPITISSHIITPRIPPRGQDPRRSRNHPGDTGHRRDDRGHQSPGVFPSFFLFFTFWAHSSHHQSLDGLEKALLNQILANQLVQQLVCLFFSIPHPLPLSSPIQGNQNRFGQVRPMGNPMLGMFP